MIDIIGKLEPMEPNELSRLDFWMHTDKELREITRIKANVKLVKEFSKNRKQLIIKFD